MDDVKAVSYLELIHTDVRSSLEGIRKEERGKLSKAIGMIDKINLNNN